MLSLDTVSPGRHLSCVHLRVAVRGARGNMLIDRDVAARLGRETVAILDAGGYTSPAGRHVSLRGWRQVDPPQSNIHLTVTCPRPSRRPEKRFIGPFRDALPETSHE
jgi:hypothetical protein